MLGIAGKSGAQTGDLRTSSVRFGQRRRLVSVRIDPAVHPLARCNIRFDCSGARDETAVLQSSDAVFSIAYTRFIGLELGLQPCVLGDGVLLRLCVGLKLLLRDLLALQSDERSFGDFEAVVFVRESCVGRFERRHRIG